MPERNGNTPDTQHVAVAVAASISDGAFAASPHWRRATAATENASTADDATAASHTPTAAARG